MEGMQEPRIKTFGNILQKLPNNYIFAQNKDMEYKCDITPKMRAVASLLIDAFEGMDHCITDTQKNIIVEVPKTKCEAVRTTLKQHFPDVSLIRNAYAMMEDLHDFILVKPLISEAPLFEKDGVSVPELEKLLVDHDADKEYAAFTKTDIQKEFQRAFELYPVNTSRLLRYAGRKGKKEEIKKRLEQIDRQRIKTVHSIQDFFRREPVERAWLFGSFSRMEERPDSDIDIMVDLDTSEPMGLLKYARMINDLESLLGRRVDMVESSSVKSFAADSINRDKVLVYERA